MESHDNLFVLSDFEEGEAVVRLADNPADYRLVLSQARFIGKRVVLEQYRFDRKPKRFEMTATEMDRLCQAWTVFQAELKAHKEQKEAAFAEIEKRAREAIEDHTVFTYKPLNMVLKIANDFLYLSIPALNLYESRVSAEEGLAKIEHLKQILREQIEDAEKLGWSKSDWPQILASYRAVFPKGENELLSIPDELEHDICP